MCHVFQPITFILASAAVESCAWKTRFIVCASALTFLLGGCTQFLAKFSNCCHSCPIRKPDIVNLFPSSFLWAGQIWIVYERLVPYMSCLICSFLAASMKGWLQSVAVSSEMHGVQPMIHSPQCHCCLTHWLFQATHTQGISVWSLQLMVSCIFIGGWGRAALTKMGSGTFV